MENTNKSVKVKKPDINSKIYLNKDTCNRSPATTPQPLCAISGGILANEAMALSKMQSYLNTKHKTYKEQNENILSIY
ncbi:hypothetical protein HZS_6341 [Henneguya salminicola]|nr:hypothetical protein HZS_6341 [Henneguya salminicola]